jgi:cellulose synthase operon protein C
MEAFVFPSPEALQVALTTGLVPADVQRSPVRFGRLPDGAMELVPSVRVGEPARRALASAGVRARPAELVLADASCWAEAVAPVRVGEPRGGLPLVLFALDASAGLLEVAGELLRLGCDRQELGLADSGAGGLLRVVDPPWYVVSRALDHLDGLTAFVPTPPGQDLVWTELGFVHPLDARLEAAAGRLLLVTGAGRWRQLPAPRWRDVDELLVPVGLPVAAPLPVDLEPPRLTVRLSLQRAGRLEPASLFVVHDGLQAVEALVRSTPEAQLDHVLFLVSGRTVVLRARPGREANTGALPGERHARLLDLPNLYAPEGTAIEPPLRRDRLRSWLAPDPDQVTWLEPTADGFGRRSVPEAAFRPLTEWVDYVLDGAAEVLEAWSRSSSFDFEPYAVAEDPLAAPRPARPLEDEEPRARQRRWSQPAAVAPREPRGPEEPGAGGASPPAVIEAPQSPTEAEAMLAREEAAFLELDAPADSQPRRQAWERLAEMYARLQRSRDAGLAWAQAVWDAPEAEVGRLARRWAETSGGRFEHLLELEAPNSEQTRGAVAHLHAAAQRGAPEVAARVAEWSAFLDRFSDDLDVRSYWLGRQAVSRLAGGDALGLARARDRVLARLQAGLSVDRDVPRLLRVMGQAGAAGAGTERAVRVAAQLEALLKAFEETPRKRSPVEAAPALTRAYVHLEFAWAFARLASPDRARQLRDGALGALDRKDPVHQYLTRAYQARIDQAAEGAAPDTPLPPEVNGLLNGLEPYMRYKVDRLRQFSQVLEPQERLDPMGSFWRSAQSARGEELSALRGVREPAELLRAIQARMGVAADTHLPPEERVRLIDGLMDFLPQLPESQALPLLQAFLTLGDALEPRHRVVVLEDALKVAGHFGRQALVKQLVSQLGNLIRELGADGVGEVGAMLVAGVRSLRRVGLRDEAGELLARASTVLKGEDTRTLQGRLALASGFAYLGAVSQAQPIIDEVQVRLGRESGLIIADRLRLTRALAQALSHASTEVALPGLLRVAQQLSWMTDSYNTNSHFCLSLVDFADALVLGHVGDDLTLNETTRRFLDEDEYLVRRRVHRDVGGEA